jgi:hypothetical protein
MITVSTTGNDDGFFIDADFVIVYYLSVQYIKTTMMPRNICLINGSFKTGYRGKDRTRLQKTSERMKPGNGTYFI